MRAYLGSMRRGFAWLFSVLCGSSLVSLVSLLRRSTFDFSLRGGDTCGVQREPRSHASRRKHASVRRIRIAAMGLEIASASWQSEGPLAPSVG